ncbi:MAG TPA: ribokinase [Alphaproteobacteria bacterium]
MIVVFGSVNIDLIFDVPTLPRPDETVLGTAYTVMPGGKGANQAVAAARDGARVAFLGCVGRDAFGQLARGSLAAAAVDIGGLAEVETPTGCAAICVDASGRNQIAVASGANRDASAAQVPDAALTGTSTAILQMEVPADEVAALIARARVRGSRTVLNLAPALPLEQRVLAAVDVLVVNEGEAAALAGAQRIALTEPVPLVRALADLLGNTVVITLGSLGSVAARPGETWAVDALQIKTVDTTGAGDAYVGVLAAALDRGAALPEALHRASVAGGLACLKPGAQPSLPIKAAIDARLSDLPPARRL